ncbi:AAA family ATPase [uncultured Nostoc sp.]|uniref:AAA family ATPase n=1 Tax=uncultured Nostoc sp. TaxID=340711 RepID=UPI0035CB31F0
MLRFLREIWELFWWAMFCPSRLQQQMNEWLPQKQKDGRRPDTSFLDILVFGNFRFIIQYLLLLFIFNIPLLLRLIERNQLLDLLQLPCVMLIAYTIGVLFLPLGLVIPLLWLIVVLNQPDRWLKGLIETIKILPPLAQIEIGLAAFGVSVSLTVWLRLQLLKNEHLSLARNVMVVGGTISVILGAWLATQNWLSLLLVSGVIGIFLFTPTESIENSHDAVEVAGAVAGAVAGVATLPLTWFLVVASLIAFALAPAKDNRVFIITTVILIALSAQNLGWLSALIIPVTLVSYYRIFPDYSFIFLGGYTFLNSLLKLFRFSDSRIRWLRPQTAKILFQFPPYTSELLWIPLPNHAQLFISEFRERPQQALTIFQYTQTFSLPGFQITLQNALPQIVADQLKQIQSIPELIFTANSDHPILPFLISPFYHLDFDSDTPTSATPLPKVKPELSILLPRLQTIIRDIQSALENENIALRERGLEKINNNVVRLQSQLPSLGFKDEAIKRWTPVLEHWQRVIELEQNEQRKLSQGELINPFQYGNPVRLDQKNLFKGRQRFANEVVRRVLDRDRPTLVLHGPRRCGKTSFLYNFPRLLPSDILPVFVDMQSSAITTSESDFCFGLVRAIHKDCKSQGVQLPNIPKRTDFQASPYTNLEDWLDEALAQIGERRILLNLDEFEKIGTAIRNGQITLRLFDQLRHLIQHYEQLGFLFSGVQTLEELGPKWSSYFISVVPIEMLYLEPNEAEELLLNPDPAFALRYAPGIVEEVLNVTNCHPYCLQLLGASMVNQANFNHTNFITTELLQASINDAFISGQPYFTNIWTEFTGTTPEEMVIGQELLLQVAKTDILLPITTEIAEQVLTRLLRYHILHKINGGYDFEIPLLKQWVRERAVRS